MMCIDEIFNDALDLTGEERAEFIKKACGSDAALLREVESLLVAHDDLLDLDLGLHVVVAKLLRSGLDLGDINCGHGVLLRKARCAWYPPRAKPAQPRGSGAIRQGIG